MEERLKTLVDALATSHGTPGFAPELFIKEFHALASLPVRLEIERILGLWKREEKAHLDTIRIFSHPNRPEEIYHPGPAARLGPHYFRIDSIRATPPLSTRSVEFTTSA